MSYPRQNANVEQYQILKMHQNQRLAKQPQHSQQVCFPHQATSGQLVASRMRTNSGGSVGSAGQRPNYRPARQESNGDSETESNQAKLKLQKNSMTILNRQQHIQSRDRSHSGGNTNTHAQYYTQVPQNIQARNSIQNEIKMQQNAQQLKSTNLNYQQQISYHTSSKNGNMVRNHSQNLPNQGMEPKQTSKKPQQQKHHMHLSNLLQQQQKSQNMQLIQPASAKNQERSQKSLPRNLEAQQPIVQSEAQCEPFEAVKSPEMTRMEAEGKLSPYFLKQVKQTQANQMTKYGQDAIMQSNESQKSYQNVESIVGACGNATSTFGNQGQRSSVAKQSTELKIEDTMGISHQVQQMMQSRGMADGKPKEPAAPHPQKQRQYPVEQKENIFQANNQQKPASNMQKIKPNITKLNASNLIRPSPSAATQLNQKLTSRNIPKQKQPSKGALLKSQRSVNDIKQLIPTTTRNNYFSKEGNVSIKKLKIKLDIPKEGMKSSRKFNNGQAMETTRSNLNLNQSQLSQRKTSLTPHRGQHPSQGSSSSGTRNMAHMRQSNHQQQRQSANKKKASKDASPVHLHYHNLNYIQVINKNTPPKQQESVVNLTQIQSSQSKLSKMSLGTKNKPQSRQRASLNGGKSASQCEVPDSSQVKKAQSLAKNVSQMMPSTNRQVSRSSNNSGFGAPASTALHKGVSLHQKITKKESIPASRRSSNSKQKSQHQKELKDRAKNNSPNFNNGSVRHSKAGVDESFVLKLQDSLLKQQNHPSLMTDSLEGTEREASKRQKESLQPSLSHSLSQRMRLPSPTPSPKPSRVPSARQQVSHSKRAELVNQLAKYIRFNEDNHGGQTQQRENDQPLHDDIVQDNLKKFLQYLECNQIININEIQQDKAQMNNLVSDIMKIDFAQLQNPEFMNDQVNQISNNARKAQQIRSASGASHSSQYRNSYANQANHGYGSTSGNDTSKYRSNSNNANHQYNTSGAIKLPNKNSQEMLQPKSENQQYFSASQNSNGKVSPFVFAGNAAGANIHHDSTTATSGVDYNGKYTQQQHGKDKSSQESMRRQSTPSMAGEYRQTSQTTQNNLQTSQNSNNSYLISSQQNFKNKDGRISGISGASNNSQTRLHTSSSQLSNKYNTSGDQIKMQRVGEQQPGYSRQQVSLPTQVSQPSSQGQPKYNNFFQSKGQNSENVRQSVEPKNQQIHNTTINLQINANVDSVNIRTRQDQPDTHATEEPHRPSKQGSRTSYDQGRPSSVQHHQQLYQQQQMQHKQVQKQNVVSSNSSMFVNGPLGVVAKQKRGGSHEEQTRDRMKQLLHGGEKDKVVSGSNNYTSRVATAAANQRAYAMKNQQAHSSQDAPHQKRVHSATTVTKGRSRSIHMKQEHLKGNQRQQLNEEIMKERDKIIKYNHQYMRKYRKFPPTCLDFYKFVKKIGNGAFGQVYLAVHKLTGKFVAIKMIELSQLKDKYSRKKVFQEVYILKKIRHSNIIRLYEVFENKKHIMMVMEYAGGGDLYHLVKKSGHLTEDETKYIFKKIAQGVAHCHCRSVLHRDIKLDNILLDGEGGVKICDFGVSRLITKNEWIQEQCGTPAYLAPEMSCNNKYQGFYVDVWSLGILLYVMLQGTVPFKASTMEALYQCQLKMNIQFHQSISPEAQSLIRRMLVIKPEDRISFPELLSHPWLRNIIGPDGLPVEGETEEENDIHDFQMSLSFQRQECNLNPLSVNVSSNAQQVSGDITERCKNAINGGESHRAVNPNDNSQQQIGNINVINIQNMFHNDHAQKFKLSYLNYCAVTQDFNTYRIDEDAIRVLETFGYPRKYVINSINNGELNHATCSYNLLVQ